VQAHFFYVNLSMLRAAQDYQIRAKPPCRPQGLNNKNQMSERKEGDSFLRRPPERKTGDLLAEAIKKMCAALRLAV
jgi:hypothetical protein